MVIRRWRTQAMVSFGNSLTDPNHRYGQTMDRIPELAGMRPRLLAAQEQLINRYGDTIASNLAPLVTAMSAVDNRHDNWQRAVYFTLQAHSAMARALGDAQRASELDSLCDLLFPDGLKVVSYSYRDEAGQAAIIAARMTPEVEQTLADIPVQGSELRTLLGHAHAAALELGALEEQRVQIREATRSVTTARTRATWVSVMGIVHDLLTLNRESDPGAAEILARMEEIERAELARSHGDGEPMSDGEGDDAAEAGGEPDGEGEQAAPDGPYGEPEDELDGGQTVLEQANDVDAV